LLPDCSFEDKEQPTNFRNERQQKIFEHLIDSYAKDLFDCCYVCNQGFRDMADKLTGPVGVNLVNSVRIDALLDLADACKPEMTVNDAAVAKVVDAVDSLDAVDIEFLTTALAAFPKEVKEEDARKAEEEKEKQKLQFMLGGTGKQKERHEPAVSFWVYLKRRLPDAALKQIQSKARAKAPKKAANKP
jgi:hypothetical protein